jgi:hypothetical protein
MVRGKMKIGLRRLSAITLALLISTPACAAEVILACKGKMDSIRWDNISPGQHIEGSVEDQAWKMTIDDVAKTLMFYPHPGFPGQSGSFGGDGDEKSISMQADKERFKDTSGWPPYLGSSINTITGQFVITIPTLGIEPPMGLRYSGTCKRAKPLF